MKWIILAIIIAIVAFWLYQGRRKNNIEDPEVKTFEEKDYYLTSNDNASDDQSSPDKSNPRH
ncbi:hypothetical protein CLH62_06005 [Marinobacter guineae]|uniref:Uncharacterized protein n=1 Tax=Marinobacter guineae TaxID=432303 RepID=A0A2G1VKW1_9GAMM|nr:hypothetical protein [Marinobacter guineae]PHQ27129.1 hypothetical protein CLH62_06005 [Marinobacter guineae]